MLLPALRGERAVGSRVRPGDLRKASSGGMAAASSRGRGRGSLLARTMAGLLLARTGWIRKFTIFFSTGLEAASARGIAAGRAERDGGDGVAVDSITRASSARRRHRSPARTMAAGVRTATDAA